MPNTSPSIHRNPTLWSILFATVLLLATGCANNDKPLNDDRRPIDLYVRGALHYNANNNDAAARSLEAALRADPNLIMARFLLGTIYREQGDYQTAADHYERLVQLDPYTYSNHYYLGLVYHLLNKLQEAAASYLAAVKLNPNDMKSNMYLGLVYTALGKPELGLPYAKKAVELDAKSGEAASNLAVVQEASGDLAAAEAGYRRALELDPNRSETLINLAGVLMAQKRYNDAVKTYEEALKLHDAPLFRVRYGLALLNAGRINDAIAQFNGVLENDARSYDALNALGEAAIAQYRASSELDEKKRADAVAYWKRSLAINPSQPRIAQLVNEYSKGLLQ